MRKWIGDRVLSNIESGKLTVVNDPYEKTITVPRKDIEDDQYGLYSPMIRAMGNSAGMLWMRLGMRAYFVHARAGWVVSNPIYSDSLDRHPGNDPSLPGPGWLREVYGCHDGLALCVLPGVHATIEDRRRPLREAEERQQRNGGSLDLPADELAGQLELFA
jgi:hypothetical protein